MKLPTFPGFSSWIRRHGYRSGNYCQ
jgi:hypothetical protein